MGYDMSDVIQGAQDGAALGTGGTTDIAAAGSVLGAAATEQTEYMPEKFRVTGADGSIDRDASGRKLADAYAGLEKRLGTGDAPPKTAEEYQIKVDKEGFDFEEFKKDPQTAGFLKAAHAKGLTNEQVNFVIGEYLGRAETLTQGAAALDSDAVLQQLSTDWGDKRDANIKLAYQAGRAAGLTPEQMNSAEVGNNVHLLKVLAHFGAQMQEDLPPAGGAAALADDRESLMKSAAYMDMNHPDHKRTYERVAKLTEQMMR